MKKFLMIGCSALALGLSVGGCANKEAHYWQKVDPNTAIYLTGVKAQQTLEQDIAQCVHEIIELTQLAAVREATGNGLDGMDQKQVTEQMSRLPKWDVPEYILNLRVDHSDYHDFDGCMMAHGWKRVRYIGPAAEFRANEVYDDTADYSVRPSVPGTRSEQQMKQLHQDR